MRRKSFVATLLAIFIALMMTSFVFAETTHTVRSGETLFRIAQQYGVSMSDLAAANRIININHIYAGQVLVIPDGTESAETVTASTTHVVRRGDTLAQIAIDYGVSMAALLSANNITNVNVIYVGQTLLIPGDSQTIVEAPAQTVVDQATDPSMLGVDHGGGKWIDVDLSEQLLVAYEGDTPVFSTLISSGLPQFPTVVGQFNVWLRYETQTMNGYALGYDYYLENVPYVMYFFEDYAIHGAYWHNNFGNPMSHGCVNASPAAAQWLFNWSEYGTLVNVRE